MKNITFTIISFLVLIGCNNNNSSGSNSGFIANCYEATNFLCVSNIYASAPIQEAAMESCDEGDNTETVETCLLEGCNYRCVNTFSDDISEIATGNILYFFEGGSSQSEAETGCEAIGGEFFDSCN